MKTAVSYVHLLSGGITSNLGILPLILFIPKIPKDYGDALRFG